MSLASLPAIVIASLTIYVGVLQLYAYYKRRQFREDLTFSLTCFAVGLYDIGCVGLYSSTSSIQGAFWQRWQAFSLAWVGMAFLWFIYDYTGKMPKLVLIIYTFLFGVSGIFQAFIHNQLTWILEKPMIKEVDLPIGSIIYHEVAPGFFTNIQSLIGITSGITILWIIIAYYRKGVKSRALPLLIAICIFFAGVINDTAVSSGIYVSVYIIEYSYLSLVILINYSISRQVLEAIQVKEALRISEERLSDAMDATNDGLFDLNLKTGEAYLSARWYTMLGYAAYELPAHIETWRSLLNPDDLPYALQVVQEYNEGKRQTHELEFRLHTKSGEWIWVLSRAKIVEYNSDGKPLRLLGTHVDISDRKKGEEEIRRVNEELEARVHERTAQLESTNKELEAFTYSVSHDLRAPLRAIDGFSRILLADYASDLSQDIGRYLHLIRENTLHMGHLIDDLLSFSRLSRQSLVKENVDHVGLVFEAIESLSQERQNRQIEIKVGDLPPSQGDTHLLRLVWINLLSNAIKYTRNQKQASITIDHFNKDGQEIYYIQDNGVGFDMKFVDKIFGVFQRLHRGDEYEGTGVGLAIVQRIIDRHGGRIWAESSPEAGATFYFTL